MSQLSPYFDRKEFACKCGCGLATVDAELLNILMVVRKQFNSPVTITSGHRCKEHNRAVGGAKNSYHVQGRAADIKVECVEPGEVYMFLTGKYPKGYGFILYETFVHVDSREETYRSSI